MQIRRSRKNQRDIPAQVAGVIDMILNTTKQRRRTRTWPLILATGGLALSIAALIIGGDRINRIRNMRKVSPDTTTQPTN